MIKLKSKFEHDNPGLSSIVNIVSARGAAIVQSVVTISKMVGVIIVIIGGFVRLGQGHTESFQTGIS